MTRKRQIIDMIQRLDDDVSYDRVMYHLAVMKGIEIGLEQVERGEVIEHEEVFRQLEEEWRESDLFGHPKRRKTSGKSGTTSRKTRPAQPKRSQTA
ncbi:MAG: hypothetical protein U0793_21860 [Gemmataceae bacterium]